MIHFTVPGVPKGKARPRVTWSHAYTPDTTVEYEEAVRKAWRDAGAERFPDKTPLQVSIIAYFPIPKKISKKRRAEWERRGKYYLGKPDRDNVEKSIMDALNDWAWDDDSRVCNGPTLKLYSETPRAEVTIEALPEFLYEEEKE